MSVGVIGCGAISGAYLDCSKKFGNWKIVALADLRIESAQAKCNEFGLGRAMSVGQLLAEPEVELVLNLTNPAAHAEVSREILRAGKHVYTEKPLAVSPSDGAGLLDLSRKVGRRIGCAPDTFMGAGLQTARHAIDTGRIGRPVAFEARMMGRGHESWHPDPAFYYQPGAGPMFDMGPYYLTALFHFFGPPSRLSGAASIAIPQRTITSQPRAGQTIEVNTPDHVCGTIEFAGGPVGTITQSFATWHPTYDAEFPITIYGTDGTLKVPDPNQFDGRVMIRRAEDADWTQVSSEHPAGYGRGVGVAEMVWAISNNRQHRANGEVAYAVLDAMAGFLKSAEEGRAHVPTTRFERPPALLAGGEFGEFANDKAAR